MGPREPDSKRTELIQKAREQQKHEELAIEIAEKLRYFGCETLTKIEQRVRALLNVS